MWVAGAVEIINDGELRGAGKQLADGGQQTEAAGYELVLEAPPCRAA